MVNFGRQEEIKSFLVKAIKAVSYVIVIDHNCKIMDGITISTDHNSYGSLYELQSADKKFAARFDYSQMSASYSTVVLKLPLEYAEDVEAVLKSAGMEKEQSLHASLTQLKPVYMTKEWEDEGKRYLMVHYQPHVCNKLLRRTLEGLGNQPTH